MLLQQRVCTRMHRVSSVAHRLLLRLLSALSDPIFLPHTFALVHARTQFYTGCKEPASKHIEPVRIIRANGTGADGLQEELLDRDEADGDERSAATGGHWGRRFVNFMRCNRDPPAAVDPAHQA
jgi:hypothetical protein